MADMLTYHESKSTEYLWRTQNEIRYPDENFAREVMQLFTIGTEELNIDGSLRYDPNGMRISTYNNDDVVEFSRVWTGFGEYV